ncbi:MAG: Nif3-like dinuclear metal center hexameric protein [Bacillota bacterium]|nr:Nif3-like dinuclear metal center hexameric protein [Bacillota bacterium]
MQAKVATIASYLEDLAPRSFALPGDNVGLQVGSFDKSVEKIYVGLDPDPEVINDALAMGADLLVTHHPFYYQPLSVIDTASPTGMLTSLALKNELSIYSAHTNYDCTFEGVSYQLARAMGINYRESSVIEITGSDQLLKLVVFVPVGYEDTVRNALSASGAGHIGKYSHCTFQVAGTGTFMPEEGAKPFLGSSGNLEKVEEIRIETILPASKKTLVVEALKVSHPYEEIAYDLYPLALEGNPVGLGLILDLDEPMDITGILEICRESLISEDIRYYTGNQKEYNRIALCGGSGGSLIEKAALAGAEIFVSGDFRYHDLKFAQGLNLDIIDAGHEATEWPAVIYLREYLEQRLESDSYKTEVYLQTSLHTQWNKLQGR